MGYAPLILLAFMFISGAFLIPVAFKAVRQEKLLLKSDLPLVPHLSATIYGDLAIQTGRIWLVAGLGMIIAIPTYLLSPCAGLLVFIGAWALKIASEIAARSESSK